VKTLEHELAWRVGKIHDEHRRAAEALDAQRRNPHRRGWGPTAAEGGELSGGVHGFASKKEG
jgi:hypothetical protein